MSVLARAPVRHEDRFRGPGSRSRPWESPHLESRDEYEVTHDTGTPHLESRCEYERREKSRVGRT
jgi:hypothetical protein